MSVCLRRLGYYSYFMHKSASNGLIKYVKRNIIAGNVLGIEDFIQRRKNMLISLNKSANELKEQFKYTSSEQSLVVSFRDIKCMCYLTENEEDLMTFEKMLRKYASVNSSANSISFQSFRLGSEISRMYYYLDKPLAAMVTVTAKELLAIFDHIVCYYIVAALLFKHKLYNEVCELYHFVQDRQFSGKRFHPINLIFFQAACYKINTDKSYANVKEELKMFVNWSQNFHIAEIAYALMYALDRNDTSLVLKYIKENDDLSKNLRVYALVRERRFSDALNYILSLPHPVHLCKYIVEVMDQQFSKLNSEMDAALLAKYENCRKMFVNSPGFNKSLEDLALETVTFFIGEMNSKYKKHKSKTASHRRYIAGAIEVY